MTKLLRDMWQLARPYWKSDERWMARLLLAVIVALNLGEVAISVMINKWNNDFYNSLQTVNKEAFFAALIKFSWLATLFIIVAVYRTYLNQMLRIKWRRWMTAKWLGDWLAMQNYYRMQLIGAATDNPDQRISEDIEQYISYTLSLSLGLLSSIVTLFSFLTILWGLSGPLDFMLGTTAIHIPAYMVWAALLYAIVGTWITMKIGRPLVGLNYNQQRFEADFRFSLVRLRENSESVAFYRGEEQEQRTFLGRFGNVVDNFWAIMKRQKMLNWFTSGYGQIAIIFPFVVAAPRFFAGKIQLGGLMQTASAFGQVQGALSYFVDAYTSIAAWKAVIERLTGFGQSLDEAQSYPSQLTIHHGGDKIEAAGLKVLLPAGGILLEKVDLAVTPGDSLLISGASGSGKSTLLRTLAGLWPFAEGELTLPDQSRMMFVPQKPYLPLGTLRQAICYPGAPDVPEPELKEMLTRCHLPHLTERLDEAGYWPQILSLGEQQRLAFARILLEKPEFLFLDEVTSALDEPTETHMYQLLATHLPQATVVSVGHRPSLKAWHKREKILPC